MPAKLTARPEVPPVFVMLCDAHGIPVPEPEFKFDPSRKWRFDFSWLGPMVALEIEGGIWTGGRHNRASGFLKDMEKYNRAAIMGWKVLRCTRKQFDSGDPELFDMLREALLVTPTD